MHPCSRPPPKDTGDPHRQPVATGCVVGCVAGAEVAAPGLGGPFEGGCPGALARVRPLRRAPDPLPPWPVLPAWVPVPAGPPAAWPPGPAPDDRPTAIAAP